MIPIVVCAAVGFLLGGFTGAAIGAIIGAIVVWMD